LKAALATLVPGVGFALIGWILPSIYPPMPLRVAHLLLISGILLAGIGIVLSAVSSPKSEESSAINVKMRDNNRIGQIGHRGKE
jgi:hypothetical protein